MVSHHIRQIKKQIFTAVLKQKGHNVIINYVLLFFRSFTLIKRLGTLESYQGAGNRLYTLFTEAFPEVILIQYSSYGINNRTKCSHSSLSFVLASVTTFELFLFIPKYLTTWKCSLSAEKRWEHCGLIGPYIFH